MHLLLFIPYESIRPRYQNSSTNLPTKLSSLQRKRDIENENGYVSFIDQQTIVRLFRSTNWRFTANILSSIKKECRNIREREKEKSGKKIWCFHVGFAAWRKKERGEEVEDGA